MFVQKFWHNIVNLMDSMLEYRKQQSGEVCFECILYVLDTYILICLL